MFAVFDIERSFDEKVCRTAREVTDFIAGADLSHFIVAEFDTADGWSRDVTDLFTADNEAETSEYADLQRAASVGDWRHQFEREMA